MSYFNVSLRSEHEIKALLLNVKLLFLVVCIYIFCDRVEAQTYDEQKWNYRQKRQSDFDGDKARSDNSQRGLEDAMVQFVVGDLQTVNFSSKKKVVNLGLNVGYIEQQFYTGQWRNYVRSDAVHAIHPIGANARLEAFNRGPHFGIGVYGDYGYYSSFQNGGAEERYSDLNASALVLAGAKHVKLSLEYQFGQKNIYLHSQDDFTSLSGPASGDYKLANLSYLYNRIAPGLLFEWEFSDLESSQQPENSLWLSIAIESPKFTNEKNIWYRLQYRSFIELKVDYCASCALAGDPMAGATSSRKSNFVIQLGKTITLFFK